MMSNYAVIKPRETIKIYLLLNRVYFSKTGSHLSKHSLGDTSGEEIHPRVATANSVLASQEAQYTQHIIRMYKHIHTHIHIESLDIPLLLASLQSHFREKKSSKLAIICF